MAFKFKIDVEVFDLENDDFAQSKYLFHGYDDVYWCDEIKIVKEVLEQELKRFERGEIPE